MFDLFRRVIFLKSVDVNNAVPLSVIIRVGLPNVFVVDFVGYRETNLENSSTITKICAHNYESGLSYISCVEIFNELHLNELKNIFTLYDILIYNFISLD